MYLLFLCELNIFEIGSELDCHRLNSFEKEERKVNKGKGNYF